MQVLRCELPCKPEELDLMECGNSARALARSPTRGDKLFSPLFERIFESPARVDSQAVHALCCATWSLSEGDLTWELFE